MKTKIMLVLCLLCSTFSYSQINSTALHQWESNKFSMFIHWGIYSELGGVWEGKNISRGLSEQIQAHAGIYSDTYAKVAKRFDPQKWNADSIVLLAKAAGMRSIVITTKHHDGFCMFYSKYTDFNVVDATPYKRDVLKELADACARHNCRLGLYFSLIDWHYPQAYPISSHNSDPITPEHFDYNKKQITELLTNYGPISELWFDMGSHSLDQSKEMYQLVHSLQADCMIGSRLGNDMNDFVVMGDNQEPDYIIGVPWQSPASFFDETWGYRSWQVRNNMHEKLQEKLASLIRVTSRGGNYLLNIGPRGDGSVVEFEKEVLLGIGQWLHKNGEAIYNTSPDPFHVAFDWGCVTSGVNKLYLHIMKLPKERTLLLPGLSGAITQVQTLSDGTACTYTQDKKGLQIVVPSKLDPEKEFEVIAITFKKGYRVPPINELPYNGKKLELSQHNAFKYYSNSAIDYNSRFRSTIKEAWTLLPLMSGTIEPVLLYTEQEKGKEILININGNDTKVKLDGEKSIPLKNELDQISWGAIYIQGPLWSGIEGLHGNVDQLDTKQVWPKNNGVPWKATNWRLGEQHSLEAGMLTGYYLLQEIDSHKEQQVLIQLTSGDGLLVLLNGKQLLLKNNPLKEDRMTDVLLLDLKKGKNQLVVKLFNNFHKQIFYSIDTLKAQKLYVTNISKINIKSGAYLPISWRLAAPTTPHQTLNLPNLRMELERD